MKNNNSGREVEEKQLFHGTDSKHIDAICLNNFDWRICGVNGTAYGKGGLKMTVQSGFTPVYHKPFLSKFTLLTLVTNDLL